MFNEIGYEKVPKNPVFSRDKRLYRTFAIQDTQGAEMSRSGAW